MAFNNFYNPYNMQQPNIDRINRQIEDLQSLKTQIQAQPQPVTPINNYINTNTPNIEMEAKILKEGQTVEDTIVQNRTLFIDEQNQKIQIKEVDGTISKEYKIVVPKDEKDLKIEELQNKILEMERRFENDRLSEPNEYGETVVKNKQSTKSNRTDNDTTTKKSSK